MKTAVFSFHKFELPFLEKLNLSFNHDLVFFESHLNKETVGLAQDFPVVSAFVSDCLDREVLKSLAKGGTKLIALRSAGYNHVDLKAAEEFNIKVTRVPAYSPHAVAEHTIGLILALNRKLYKSYNRVREGNFSLEGLLGFDLSGKTAGVIGTGKIGSIVAEILKAFGCKVLAYDISYNEDCRKKGIEYVDLEELCRNSDIVTLHCPLLPATKHIIQKQSLQWMKKGVMLINTSRGALVDTRAVIEGLKSAHIGYLGLDVYEEEEGLFFEDCSNQIIADDVFSRLLTFPNVLITAHQGFFTSNALHNIANCTLQNIFDFERGQFLKNEIKTTK